MPEHTLHTAQVLLPMGGLAPVADAGVLLDECGTVIAAGPLADLPGMHDARRDHQILMPGVINAHAHMTDARCEQPVPGGEGLNAWVRGLLSARAEAESNGVELATAVADVLARMIQLGTVAIGEVTNTLDTLVPIAASGLRCRFINELIGFRGERAGAIIEAAVQALNDVAWPNGVAPTLAAHAPYSVSPALMQAIAGAAAERGLRFHQHLAEDPAERQLYERGDGPWRDLLGMLGAWDESWVPPGVSPIEFYDRLGVLGERFVAVHLADAGADELRLLASRGAHAVLSPTSNLHITGLLPDLEAIVSAGLPFALGTDGRGSNGSVDVFTEARLLHDRWSKAPPGLLLNALTAVGAHVLQMPDLGVIRPGARPGLLAISLPEARPDLAYLEPAILRAPDHARELFGWHRAEP